MKKGCLISIIVFALILAGIVIWLLGISLDDVKMLFKGKIEIENIVWTNDKDGDGLNDLDDIAQGARKEVANKPKYKSAYYVGGYPPSSEGVCTDVIWRALKNAGYDLKSLMDADIAKNTAEYPRVEGKPDPNIDFRRVSNQLVFFRKYAKSLTTEVKPYNREILSQWQRGDIVTLKNTEHIAIISDKRRRDGVPLILHNASDYAREQDRLLDWRNKITGHFRILNDKIGN